MIIENLLLVCSTLILFIAYKLDKSNFIFTPLKLFTFVSLLYLILPGFYLINIKPESIFWSLNKNFILLENISILIFITIFVFIFKTIEIIKIPTYRKNFNSNIILLSIFFLILSVYAKIYMYQSGAFFLEDKYNDSINNIPRLITFLNNLHLWGFMLLFIYYFRITNGKIFKNKFYTYKYLAFIYFLITIIVPILQGRRFGVIFPILMLLGLYSFYNKMQLFKLSKYVILILIVFILITMLRLTQSVMLSKGMDSGDILGVFTAFDTSILSVLFDGIIGRLGNVYIVLNRIIEYKVTHGLEPVFNSFSLAFQGLIPAFIWPDKPDLSIGNILGKELNLINVENVLTGINAGWIGEGFYNNDILGVVQASSLYAVTIGIMYKIIDKNYDTGKLIFLMYFIFLFSGYQMELAMTFNNFLKGSIIQILIVITVTSIPAIKLKKVKK